MRGDSLEMIGDHSEQSLEKPFRNDLTKTEKGFTMRHAIYIDVYRAECKVRPGASTYICIAILSQGGSEKLLTKPDYRR